MDGYSRHEKYASMAVVDFDFLKKLEGLRVVDELFWKEPKQMEHWWESSPIFTVYNCLNIHFSNPLDFFPFCLIFLICSPNVHLKVTL